MERIDITKEVPVSIVETKGFAKPAVDTDEVKRVALEALLITAAVPPPAIIANDHVITGLKSANVETITAVPARVAKGMAIVSNKLSINGI